MNTKRMTSMVNFVQSVQRQCRPQYFCIRRNFTRLASISNHIQHNESNYFDQQKLWLTFLQAPARSRPNTRSQMLKVYEISNVTTLIYRNEFFSTHVNFKPNNRSLQQILITARQWNCGKVMFSEECVSPQGGGTPGPRYPGDEY